jgi:hypothetical protein
VPSPGAPEEGFVKQDIAERFRQIGY